MDLPLQVLTEHHAPPALLAEGARLRRAGILVSRRPLGPQPKAGIPPVQFFVQRAVGGERLQQFALAFAERLKRARPGAAAAPFAQKLREPELQRSEERRVGKE